MNTQNNIEHRTAILLLLITAVLWSLGGVLIKSVTWHPLAIAGGRSIVASAVIWLYFAVILKRAPQFKFSFNQIGGALCYMLTVTLYVTANKLTTNANAIVLQYTAPIYVALFGAWFLKERLRTIDILTTLVVLGGIALFFLDKLTNDSLLGIIVALLSGLTMGWMALFVRKQKDGSSLESLLLGNLLTACIGIPFMVTNTVPDSTGLLYIAILGAVQIGVPYILYSIALKKATALEGVLMTMLEPILSPLWVLLALNELPGTMSFIGGAIVIIAVLIRGVLGVRR
ncbi:MAG: DMT family transporter [Candidatus Kapabacteria bacterium]|nr:DMT family transporter [Candidatus Kapabacteria bacterium]MBX7154267.1 DMT family transporter [Bacteroidota bacterium]